jgi:glycerate 2-kinase
MPYNCEKFKIIVQNLYKLAIESANPYVLTLNSVRIKAPIIKIENYHTDITQYKHIYVIGAGKGVAGMAMGLEKILSAKKPADLITEGRIIVNHGSGKNMTLKKIKLMEAGHPIPDESSLLGADKIMEIIRKITKDDLVFYLATGGGSSLLAMPADGISLKDLQTTFKLLISSKIPLEEMNCVRKHLDMTKGGQLAEHIYPANLITLAISDVVGDRIDLISSGPTIPDPYTFKDAYKVLKKYNLWGKVPQTVMTRIEKEFKGELIETPKPNKVVFKNTRSFVIGKNRMALDRVAETISSMGYDVFINEEPVIGEARKTACIYAIKIMGMAKKLVSPLFIISGGETVVDIKGNGLGGRNQEFALAFALQMERLGFEKFICLSCSTDGTDYIAEAAGAMIDGSSLEKARQIGLDPQKLLDNNDSYHFHEPIKTIIKTGPTGTNVNDIQIIVIW